MFFARVKFALPVLAASLILYPFLKDISLRLQNRETDNTVFAGDSYDSRSSSMPVHREKSIPEGRAATSVEMDFQAEIYENTGAYSNLFQTAPVNSGLRMELSKTNELALVYSQSNGNVTALTVVPKVEFNHPYRISIKYLAESRLLLASADGKEVSITDPAAAPAFTDFALGKGFDQNRVFSGRIQDFNVRVKTMSPWPAGRIIGAALTGLPSILILLSGGVLLVLAGKRLLSCEIPPSLRRFIETAWAGFTEPAGRLNIRPFVFLGGIAAALLPLALVLQFKANIGYYDDWYDHMWAISYMGEYFRQHFHFPALINSNQTIGIAIPVFYGHALYATLAFISAFLGGNLAVRLTLIAVFLWLFASTYTLGCKLTSKKAVSFLGACLILWNTFLMSMLYNGGTLPIVISSTLLGVAATLCFHIALSQTGRERVELGLALAFCCATLMSWPPNLVEGGVILATTALLLSMYMFFEDKSGMLPKVKTLLLSFGAAVLIALPWVLIVLKYMKSLPIAIKSRGVHGLSYYQGIDSFWLRISSLPLDMRTLANGMEGMKFATPFCEAQFNMPLIIMMLASVVLSVYLVWRNRSGQWWTILLAVPVFMTGYYATLSLSSWLVTHLPSFLRSVDLHYRYIAHVNIAAALGLISAWLFLGRHASDRQWKAITGLGIFLAGVSIQAVYLKLVHGNEVSSLPGSQYCLGDEKGHFGIKRDKRDSLLDSPGTNGEVFDYFDAKTFHPCPDETIKQVTASATILPGRGWKFGNVTGPVSLSLPSETVVRIGMYPFPWNQLTVDGKQVAPGEVCYWGPTASVVMRLPQGSHTFSIEQKIPRAWFIARNIALYLHIILFCTVIGYGLRRLRMMFQAARAG